MRGIRRGPPRAAADVVGNAGEKGYEEDMVGRDEVLPDAIAAAELLAVKAHSWLNMVTVIGGSASTLHDELDALERADLRFLLGAMVRKTNALTESMEEVLRLLEPPPGPDLRTPEAARAVVARCSCGWASSPTLTAAMAGDQWDDHVGSGVVDVDVRHDVGFGLTPWSGSLT